MSVSDFQCFLYLFPSCFPKRFFSLSLVSLPLLFSQSLRFSLSFCLSLSLSLCIYLALSLSLSLSVASVALSLVSFVLVAVPVSVHIVAVNLFLPVLGLSKFAKLARSVTRSRQFSAHLPTLKDPTKQSNLAHVRPPNPFIPADPFDYLLYTINPAWVISIADDVPECRHYAAVQTGSAQDAATHTPALLCI